MKSRQTFPHGAQVSDMAHWPLWFFLGGGGVVKILCFEKKITSLCDLDFINEQLYINMSFYCSLLLPVHGEFQFVENVQNTKK